MLVSGGDLGIKGTACERDTGATANFCHATGGPRLHPKGANKKTNDLVLRWFFCETSCSRKCPGEAPTATRGDNGKREGTLILDFEVFLHAPPFAHLITLGKK